MRKGTKRWYIEEIKKALDEHKVYSDKLMELVEEGKVNSGCLLIYSNTSIFPSKWLFGFDGHKCKLYGWVYEETKVTEFAVQLRWAQKEIENIKNFLADDTQTGWTKNNK